MADVILVVEDEAIIADDIQATLQALGYVVPRPVASGAAALAAAAASRPRLVLMDVKLQGPMDGIEAARLMRERHGVPVVYLTSHSDEATLARAKASHPYGYLLKPFNDRELRTAIEVALHRHDMERRLAEREHWFATTLQSLGDAVIATDPAERVTFMNQPAEALTGWAADEAQGHPVSTVLRLFDEQGAALDRALSLALREGSPAGWRAAVALIDRRGRRVVVDERVAPIIDAYGRLLGGVVVLRDVTERQRVEQRLAISERLASIGTMAAGMAHEINNPLTAVTANVALAIEAAAAMRATLPPQGGAAVATLDELRAALADAERGADRVRRIVEELKRFARVEDASRRSVVALPDMLDMTVKLIENQLRHNARVVRAYGPVPPVEANEGQLTQVFLNLLVNGAQAVGDGPVGDHEVRITTRTDDAGRAVVEVSDTGRGLAAADLPRLFDPFLSTTTIGAGTGLGLALCHNVVTSLGGEIAVESEVGRGTTFRVTLPAAPTPRPRAATPTPVADPPTRRGRVLVIDDEPAIARSIERILRAQHDVTVETDPRAALARLLGGESYDVIFCDIMMPDLSGMDLYEAVAAARPEAAARVVFLSGGAFSPRARAFLDAATNRCLAKPFSVSTLRSVAADYVK
jgi:PAS domain S-box-containing protein